MCGVCVSYWQSSTQRPNYPQTRPPPVPAMQEVPAAQTAGSSQVLQTVIVSTYRNVHILYGVDCNFQLTRWHQGLLSQLFCLVAYLFKRIKNNLGYKHGAIISPEHPGKVIKVKKALLITTSMVNCGPKSKFEEITFT